MSLTAQYGKQIRARTKTVFFTGSTALKKGMGLCYDFDYTGSGTGQAATDPAPERDWRVELPSLTNNQWFAGVAATDYPAQSGGQYIEIHEPGSVCELAIISACTVASTRLTCIAGGIAAGYWYAGGFDGEGSAMALETTDTPSASILAGVLLASMDGTATITTSEVITKTSSGIGSIAVAGDRAFIFSCREASGGASAMTAAIYDIASATGDTVTLDGATCSASAVVNMVIVRGYPTVLAKLDHGRPSGLCAFTDPGAGGAMTPMASGYNFLLCGGVTMAANATYTVTTPTRFGTRIAFVNLGEHGGSTYLNVITIAGTGVAGTALASATEAATGVNDLFVAEWFGGWRSLVIGGWTEA